MRPHLSVCAALAGITVGFAAPTLSTQAQNFAGCSRLIAPNGSVTWICPPATVVGGRWRGTQYIPACPTGMAYSRDTNRCLPAQNVGGVIPCSADDRTFIPGRG